MADGITAKWTGVREFERALEAKKRSMDRATLWALRQSAKKVASAAKKRTPVYRGPNSVKVAAVRRARKAGVSLSGGRLAAGERVEGNRVVAGLLRASIRPGRIRRDGRGYTIRVGPTGPRVYLYARKIEDRTHFMSGGLHEAEGEFKAIYAAAWGRALKAGSRRG